MELPMRLVNLFICIALAMLAAATAGCARAKRDTTGFALKDKVVLEAPFEETWQAVKHVLRARGVEIYTRDKRGLFVAYSNMNRRLLVPHRTKYTIELMDISENETAIHIETLREVYGVTLLTHPDWHARQAKDNSEATAIFQAVEAKLNAPAEDKALATGDLPEPVEAAPAS
jgi:hypothetical protein